MKIKYRNSIVLFIDVLGFSNLVFNDDQTKIGNYFNYILSNVKSFLPSKSFKYLFISDSIVISAEKTKENLSELIFAIGKIQYQLLLKGVLIRGAISMGKLYINKSNNIIVGPGLINAYKLEKRAKVPRIIVDRSFIPNMYNSRNEFTSSINKIFSQLYGEADEKIKFDRSLKDDQPYINYLRYFARYGPTYKDKYLTEILNLFKENIFSNNHFEKYNWLLKEMREELSLAKTHYELHQEIKSSKSRVRKIAKFQKALDIF